MLSDHDSLQRYPNNSVRQRGAWKAHISRRRRLLIESECRPDPPTPEWSLRDLETA
jgi:hypothetical protein